MLKKQIRGKKGPLWGALSPLLCSVLRKDDHFERKEKKGGGNGEKTGIAFLGRSFFVLPGGGLNASLHCKGRVRKCKDVP